MDTSSVYKYIPMRREYQYEISPNIISRIRLYHKKSLRPLAASASAVPLQVTVLLQQTVHHGMEEKCFGGTLLRLLGPLVHRGYHLIPYPRSPLHRPHSRCDDRVDQPIVDAPIDGGGSVTRGGLGGLFSGKPVPSIPSVFKIETSL